MRAVSLLAVLALVTAVATGDNWLTDMTKGVKGTVCLATVTPKLTSDCLQAFDDEVGSRPKDESEKKVSPESTHNS